MPRYAPALSPKVLKALHYEARRRGMPMTRLADSCITEVLQGTKGWIQAEAECEDPSPHRKQPQVNSDL